jgi:hypothetical protein
VTSRWFLFFESMDPLLLVVELSALFFFCTLLASFSFKVSKGSVSRRAAALSQRISFSLVEVVALSSFVLGFVLFDLFVAFNEDDAAETFGFFFIAFVLVVAALAAFFVNVHYYYMLSCVGGSDVTLRVIYADFVSNGLCLLRIVFC